MAINIWSALLKSESITEIFVPPDLDLEVSLNEFHETLKKHLADKGVQNTSLAIEEVKWDEGKHSQRRIVARYTGSDAPQNIQQILIGLDNVGSFRYVEEKTFLTRPELPKYPTSPTNQSSGLSSPSLPLWGIGIAIVSAILLFSGAAGIGLIGLLVGGALIALYVKNRNEYDADQALLSQYKSLRSQYDKDMDTWRQAWRKWENDVLETAYLQATTNAFGRFQRSVASCVRYAITELFEDKKAELKETRTKEITEQQIEDQMKRKQESFK